MKSIKHNISSFQELARPFEIECNYCKVRSKVQDSAVIVCPKCNSVICVTR